MQNYALARAGIATASAWFSVRYAHDREALAWGKRADEEARRALEQDASLADAHYALASAAGTMYGGFDWNILLDRTATALVLDRSLDLAHLARMRAYYHLGLFDEAREEGRLAQALNPSPNVEFARLEIASQLFTGRFDSAVKEATALLSRTDAPAVRHYLGLARYYVGDGTGAREMLASITRSGRPDVRAQASLASVEAALGMQPGGTCTRLRRTAQPRTWIITWLTASARHVAQLGDTDESLKWLVQAADTGFPCYPWFERDALLDPMRRQPGFVRLLTRLRDAHEQARRRAQ